MTLTFDAYMDRKELITVMTGVPMDGSPPVLIDRGTGASARCWPARLDGIPRTIASFGMVPRPEPRHGDNPWWTALPIAEDAPEVPLSIVVGARRSGTRSSPRGARAPGGPEPASSPKRASRRTRKRA